VSAYQAGAESLEKNKNANAKQKKWKTFRTGGAGNTLPTTAL
jgi:hypothetical protein